MRKTRKPTIQRIAMTLAAALVGGSMLMMAAILIQHPQPAAANGGDLDEAVSTYPDIANTRLDACKLCHTNSIPDLNAYGTAYNSNGRNADALHDIESLDSDGDSFSNLAEPQALTFPGDASDHPAAATATVTTEPTLTPTPTTTPGFGGSSNPIYLPLLMKRRPISIGGTIP